MPTAPKFSIVIPTRNRAATLRWSLRTCLESAHSDFEVVVSDNDSSDGTAAVVAEFKDERVRYVRTPNYFSMSRNFEYGLRHASGEFVIFIGDDDGILPFSLNVLDAVFEKNPSLDHVDWILNPFLWPHAPSTDLSLNWVSNLRSPVIETAGQAWARVNHPRSSHYNDLNGFNLYHGCIRRRVLDEAAAAGFPIFDLPVPDIGGAVRVLRFAKKKMVLAVALTINGTSNMSTGWAHHLMRSSEAQKAILADFLKETAQDFPNSTVARYTRSRPNSFLGSLIDEYLERLGDLTQLNLQSWRTIYLDHLIRFPKPEMRELLAETNKLFSWCGERGASNATPLSEADVEWYRPIQNRVPHSYGEPLMISADGANAAASSSGFPVRRIADPRIVSIEQGAKGVVMKVRSEGEEFTIHDYVALTTSILTGGSADVVKLMLEEPALFQLGVLARVTGHLAADAAGKAQA